MLNSMGFAIKQGFRQVFRNRAMSAASMFSITAMLLILGLFFVLVVNVNMITETAKKQFDTIQIYLEEETTYESAVVIQETLKAMEGVESVTYLDKEQALEEWKITKWGEKSYLLDGIEPNPLPNSLVIKVLYLEAADSVVDKAGTFDGIEEIKYYKSTVDQIMKVTDFVQFGALIVILFLVIISVIVVSNTVKLTVLAREREISIMKYIGATNWFIRGPFLIEGIIIGIISAAVSLGAIGAVYYKLTALIGQEIFVMLSTSMVPERFLIFNLIWIFLALGISIGACGSIVSMRRFLDT